jgi:hypothetical protein
VPEVCRLAILGIGQHASKACPGRNDPIEFMQRDLPFGAADDRLRHTGSRAPRRIFGPSPWQV